MRKGWMKVGAAVLLVSGLWFGSSVGHAALPVDQNFDGVVAHSYGSSMTEGNVTYAVTGSNVDMVVAAGSSYGITDTTGVLSGNVLTEVNMVATGVSIQAMESVKISSLSFYADQVFTVRGLLAGTVVAEVTGVSVGSAGSVGTTGSAITIGTPYVDAYGSGARLTFDGALWGEVDRVELVFAAGTMWFMDDVLFGPAVPVVSPIPSSTTSPTPNVSSTPLPSPTPSAAPEPSLSPSPTPTPEPISSPSPSSTPIPIMVVYVPPAVFEPYVQISEPTPAPMPVPLLDSEPVREPVVEPIAVIAPDPIIETVVTVFKDVVGHWAADSIGKLRAIGVIQGDSDGGFYPERITTRNEFVVMVLRIMGMKDVDWNDVMRTGVSEGLISKGENGFREGEGMSREEAFTVLGRAYGRLGVVDEADDENPYTYLYRFDDYWKVSEWARPSVGMGVKLGLIQGSGDKINAKKTMSRAEMATIIDRLIEKMDKNRK